MVLVKFGLYFNLKKIFWMKAQFKRAIKRKNVPKAKKNNNFFCHNNKEKEGKH